MINFIVYDHFIIQCIKLKIDSTNSCPFLVSLYSTFGGISLYACLSKIPSLSSSLSLLANVLLLIPFINSLNCLYLTGLVVQHKGISISNVPLFVTKFRSFVVCNINLLESYPSKLQLFSYNGNLFTCCLFVSFMTLGVI